MLDIRKVKSENTVYVSGTVRDIDIVEGTTKDGRGYVRGTVNVLVNQTIDEEKLESVVPIKMFTMRKKKDGTLNSFYDTIVGYREKLIALSSCDEEDIDKASKVTIGRGQLKENTYFDTNSNQLRTSWSIDSSFINTKRTGDKEGATFELTGVVAKMKAEERGGEETGRLLVNLVLGCYNGTVDVVELVAKDSKKDFIEQNWNEGDTVKVVGNVITSFEEKIIKEDLGFGEPIERKKTTSRRELLITGGSATGFDEDKAYDMDTVTVALKERVARNKELENTKPKPKTAPKPTFAGSEDDFGF